MTKELTDNQLAAAYDEVARYLNYADGGQEVAEPLDDVSEEAVENGLTPNERKREMLLALTEMTGEVAARAARILADGYDSSLNA